MSAGTIATFSMAEWEETVRLFALVAVPVRCSQIPSSDRTIHPMSLHSMSRATFHQQAREQTRNMVRVHVVYGP